MDHSEVKHFPKVDHTPAELPDWAKLLLKGAGLIEQKGHAKGTQFDAHGGMCFFGALKAADGKGYNDIASEVVFDAANRFDISLTGMAARGCAGASWNNAPERTKEEVIAKMRAVALGG